MRFLIFTVSLFLATTVYANDHNINKSGFLSKKLSVSALSKIDNSSSNIEDERELAFSGRFIFISQTSFLCFCNVIKLVLPSYV